MTAKRAALLLVALLLASAAPAKKQTVGAPTVVPNEKEAAGTPYRIEGEWIRYETGGILIQVRCLTEEERVGFFRQRTRLKTDPFPPSALYPEGFTIFELSFLNGSKQGFQFSPGMAAIVRGSRAELEPYDLGSLYSYFLQLLEGDDAAVEAALDAIYTRTVLLNPGERTTQLLIFEGLSARTKKFTLNLDYLLFGSTTQDLAFPFRVLREESR